MKVVIVKSPKILSGFLRMIFGIKKNKEQINFFGYRIAVTFFVAFYIMMCYNLKC